jgi:NAD(P)-dependent dehydrogenase (short-subunit alcohol dehydrogenase family)
MSTNNDSLAGRTVLITGANRGLGRSLVEAALGRGARRVYAGSRQPLIHPDGRVTPLRLDITDAAQIEAAAKTVDELDVLVNNAGLAIYGDLADRSALERQFAVNVLGPHAVTYAFQELLIAAGGVGTVVNVLSLAAVAPVPTAAGYSISKAAAYSLTQSLRMLLAPRGVRVHAVLSGPIDTDMARGLPIEKAAPDEVARAIFDGVAAGTQDIFPDPWSANALAEAWPTSPAKSLERENSALVALLG